MPENTEDKTPAVEAPQDAAQSSDTKAEATNELSEDDLKAVAGGARKIIR
jgi:hypothetical protein